MMPHPTPEDIIGFVLRALDTKDTTRIARHLTSCNECLDLVGSWLFEEAWNDIESAEESLHTVPLNLGKLGYQG